MRELLMDKGLSLSSMAVAVIIMIVFAVDLAVQLPFGRPSMILDIGFVVCAAIVAFLSWTTYREIR